MPIDRVSGHPDYSSTGPSKYIPLIFSAKTLKRFYAKTWLTEITVNDYIGEITSKGDKVVIRTIPDITIRPYAKGIELLLENPESPAIELTIDYADYFNFAIDDVDKQEFDVDRVGEWADNASKRLKIHVESVMLPVFLDQVDALNKGANAGKISQNINLGTTGTPRTLDSTNVIEFITECTQVLDEQDCPEDDQKFMIIPAWMAGLIKRSDLSDASFSGLGKSPLLNGAIGAIDGFTLYKSNLLPKTSNYTNIFFGHKQANAFAFTLTKTEAYRPEKGFCEAMKGLQVYGGKVILPTLVGEAVVAKA